jgi:hypothetical protein
MKFNEFMAQQQAQNPQQQPMQQPMQQVPQQNVQQNQVQSNFDDEKIKQILKTRLEQVMSGLQNVPKQKIVHLLGTIIREFQQNLDLSNSQVRKAYMTSRQQ